MLFDWVSHQFWSITWTIMSRLKKSVIRSILTHYFDLSFPASLQSIRKFHAAIQKKLNIKISERALRKILKNNAWYQTNVTRPKKFLMRKHYSQGVGLSASADPCYIQLPNKTVFKCLIVADSCSKYVFGTILPEVNPQELKRAFGRLFSGWTVTSLWGPWLDHIFPTKKCF